MSVPKYILYSYWRSSCSWRVRTVLHLKSIPFECRPVNLFSSEQTEPEFSQLNPLGLVPLLVVQFDDGRVENLFESLAIIDYLEQVHPLPSIYPTDPIQRAKVSGVAQAICSGIQPLQNLGPMLKVQGNLY